MTCNSRVIVAVAAVAIVLLMAPANMMRCARAYRSQQLMRMRVLLQFKAIIVMIGVIWWRAL